MDSAEGLKLSGLLKLKKKKKNLFSRRSIGKGGNQDLIRLLRQIHGSFSVSRGDFLEFRVRFY